MSDFNYEEYSLQHLEEWLHDAMSSDAKPSEIYDTITKTVQEVVDYHEKNLNDAKELLARLKGTYNPYSTAYECDWYNNWYNESNPPYFYTGSSVTNVGVGTFEIGNYISFDSDLKPDRVKRWILPVESMEEEYFVTFPDDLLQAANLKEGDQIEWIEQDDGSCILRKVNRTLGSNEC